ncbi:alpha/beta hydrolase [Candidatus Parcubacteria bacterium]|nr:alpha/beta hydrolase [Candidatus Parcubacteria bacterium]
MRALIFEQGEKTRFYRAKRGRVLIILHGWQSSKEKWQTIKQELQKCTENGSQCIEIKVIIPDLPGFKKETELDRVWDLDDYINWFEKYSSGLSEPFYLLGHSFGGRMAIKFAAKHPEKLKELILVSSAGIKSKQNILYLTFLAYAKKFKWIFLKLPLFKNLFPILRKIFYKYILRKTDYINAEKMPYLQKTFKKVIAEDLTPYLSQIKTPTLIIWGKGDKITPLSDAYLMKEKIKNSKLEILKSVGHVPHLKNPEILTQKIKKFMEEQI